MFFNSKPTHLDNAMALYYDVYLHLIRADGISVNPELAHQHAQMAANGYMLQYYSLKDQGL